MQQQETKQSFGKLGKLKKPGLFHRRWKGRGIAELRVGSASMDYVLVLGVILPLVLFLFTVVPRMIQLVYEMAVVIVSSPLMQITLP